MANPQHIEWLLEGVGSWNDRVLEGGFTPDFENADIYEEFRKAGKLDREGMVPLGGIIMNSHAIPFIATRAIAEFYREFVHALDEKPRYYNSNDLPQLVTANLSGSRLCRANLAGANLSYIDLTGVDLVEANLARANLEFSFLMKADVAFANFLKASLASANLSHAYLYGSCFEGSDLRGSNLTEANFGRANLLSANLHGATVDNANFDEANLKDANLGGTMFWRADIFSKYGPSPKQYEGNG